MMMNIESDKKGKKLLFMVFKRFSQLQSDRYYKVIFLCKTYKKGFFKLHKKIIKNIFFLNLKVIIPYNIIFKAQ